MNISSQVLDSTDFNALKISIAGPEKIRSWSYGEVTKPETINYRTFKPEKDGLFCAKIFGPVRDYECLCGKYKRIKYKGIICEKCGVEITSSKVRRERMGHIELAAPVAHIWFLKSLPSRISTMLNIMPKYVEKVIYFETLIVTDARMTPLENGQLLSDEEYERYQSEYGIGSFEVGMGAEAIHKLLSAIDLTKLRDKLRRELSETKSELRRTKIIKRLGLTESFIESNNRPEWMILTVLPVIPPEIRPLVQLDGGNFASADLNELYRRVINRNNRLRKLLELEAPDIIIKNEKRMLQESVDSLLDNSKSANPVKAQNKRPFKSLSDMLKGKQGRFRQNLLGKRVDYSGRSVIVVGPNLKLHQCGLPKKMALELFKPFIYAKLELYGMSNGIRHSKKLVDSEKPEVWDILEEVIREHPVLLNRAPTLHRLGIQAFEPLLIEGKAIQLHPLVCKSFNADFDGDQMAVHVPLSIEAQAEARVLMMSSNNILNPQDGKPNIIPSQDVLLGLYYMTLDPLDGASAKPRAIISSLEELEHALFTKRIGLNDPILFRYSFRKEEEDGESDGIEEEEDRDGEDEEDGRESESTVSEEETTEYRKVVTTPGRVKVFELLPEACKRKFGFSLVNMAIGKKEIAKIVNLVFEETDQDETSLFCDNIMQLGFKSSTLSGISIGKDDMVIPTAKTKLVSKAAEDVRNVNLQYQEGLITAGERYNRVIEIWDNCINLVKKLLVSEISVNRAGGTANSLFLFTTSGARGNESNIQQMCGIRGLLAKQSGEIIETPVLSNFKEGLSVLEYFLSTYTGRKSMVDTALRTANAGYLTRRLVDVAQDCIVIDEDCRTDKGIGMEAKIENGIVKISLASKIIGRTALRDVVAPDGEIIVQGGNLIDEKIASSIEGAGIRRVVVRSVLTCRHEYGVCAKCYGRDLTTKRLVSVGEAVGIVAAQAVGEPGTQLTMNTRHLGGAMITGTESNIISPDDGTLSIVNMESIANRDGVVMVVSKDAEMVISRGEKVVAKYSLPFGAKVLCRDGDNVRKGDYLAEWDPYNYSIIAMHDGIVEFKDLVDGISLKEKIDELTGISSKNIIDWRRFRNKQTMKPSLIVSGEGKSSNHELFIGTVLNVTNGQEVKAGDVLARTQKDSIKNRDITGGLPRVAELFEARKPKNYAVMSAIDGTVMFGDKDYKTRRVIRVVPDSEEDREVSYIIPKGKHLFVKDGDRIKKGDDIIDGDKVPHDILKILGIEAFTEYMVAEIQKVYEMQGISINDKHIEIILNMMLKKIEIDDPGETTLLVGDTMDRSEFEEINRKALEAGIRPARGENILLGITKASLQSKSFMSAASFQETVKVLTDASVRGKIDNLEGLKENIIVGKLIPAGTGLLVQKIKGEARPETAQRKQ
ncbi:MAG: DNA-directed RNA polymerase subunit beta' [Rickettsiales bacterium]|nr:DNA-directed RNA polymerase subunit beta' [Rickettsiales bacterium]